MPTFLFSASKNLNAATWLRRTSCCCGVKSAPAELWGVAIVMMMPGETDELPCAARGPDSPP